MTAPADMKADLQGMFWSGAGLDFRIPKLETAEQALGVFKNKLAEIAWNCLAAFENNPASLAQTRSMLQGRAASGIDADHLAQVGNYGDGAKRLMEMIAAGAFGLNGEAASALHGLVGKEEALTWGAFRNSDIAIGGVGYLPPHHALLPEIAKRGFAFIERSLEPREGAVAAFLFMARSQFFHDANKRTASLMMNGHLMRHGYCPICVLNRDAQAFHKELTAFYNTGDATDMMRFFAETAEIMYVRESAAHPVGHAKGAYADKA